MALLGQPELRRVSSIEALERCLCCFQNMLGSGGAGHCWRLLLDQEPFLGVLRVKAQFPGSEQVLSTRFSKVLGGTGIPDSQRSGGHSGGDSSLRDEGTGGVSGTISKGNRLSD